MNAPTAPHAPTTPTTASTATAAGATAAVEAHRDDLRQMLDKTLTTLNLEFIVPRPTVHVVVAYRYGLRDDHSYVVGAYATETLARQAADEHVQHRGGKYGCEVLACDIRHTTDEYDPLPPQVAYFESPYFGILGRGSQCADRSDHAKDLDSAIWFLEETRLPLLLRRLLSKAFNLLRWINPTKP